MPPPFAQVFTLRRAEFGELRHGKHPLLAGEGQGYQLNLQILSKDMRIHNWLHPYAGNQLADCVLAISIRRSIFRAALPEAKNCLHPHGDPDF
jgi:hypothetical protein